MRILEHCTASASPEVQVQINALREAFSQDVNKPFELKPSLGLRSPSLETNPTPPATQSSHHGLPISGANSWTHLQDAATSKTLSPSREYGQSYENMPTQHPMLSNKSSFSVTSQAGYVPAGVQHVTSAPQQGYALEPVISNEQHTPVWDPSGIFQQWNTAFGVQAQTPPQPPPVQIPRVQPTSAPVMQHPQQSPVGGQPLFPSQHIPSSAGSVIPEPMPHMPTVTPVMWQDAFSNAYASGHGHKRYREEPLEQGHYDQYAKRRG